MCMLGGRPSSYRSQPKLSGTNIFCRWLPDGRQALVYGMNIEAEEALAMVLPLPLPPGSADDAVRFVDMQYPKFFVEMNDGFPAITVMQAAPRGGFGGGGSTKSRPQLEVHKSGDFVASFVPSIDDFDRLDPRFRLAPTVWNDLPTYADWGFAVFTLAEPAHDKGILQRLFKKDEQRTIRPMSLTFPSRFDALFFPTVHVHDGQVHAVADFDHFLYWQATDRAAVVQNRLPEQKVVEIPDLTQPRDIFDEYSRVTDKSAHGFLDIDRTAGLIDGSAVIRRERIRGRIANEDHWLLNEA